MITITAKVTPAESGVEYLYVSTPYHPRFPNKARALGGKWVAATKAWAFDPRDADRVADLCRELFGRDWRPMTEPNVTVRVTLRVDPHIAICDMWAGGASYWLLGREILRRPSRDAAVTPGPGVAIVGGGFAPSGGSRANPCIGAPVDEAVVLEVRDVPQPLVEAARATPSSGVTLEVVQDSAPSSLPLATLFSPPGSDDAIAAVIAAFEKLSATQQAECLRRLNASLPNA